MTGSVLQLWLVPFDRSKLRRHCGADTVVVRAAVQRTGDKIMAYAVLRWVTLVCAPHLCCPFLIVALPLENDPAPHERTCLPVTTFAVMFFNADNVLMACAAVSMFQIHFIRRLFNNSTHSHAGPNRL